MLLSYFHTICAFQRIVCNETAKQFFFSLGAMHTSEFLSKKMTCNVVLLCHSIYMHGDLERVVLVVTLIFPQ